ncbi:MAG TPA: hypothetical protein VF297_12600 [Pyrinomonadaceae bacterium]
MQLLNTRLHSPGNAQLAARAAEAASVLPDTTGDRDGLGRRARVARSLSGLMLRIQTFLGAALSGLAVSVQLGNVLICLSMLLLGPSVVLGLLP